MLPEGMTVTMGLLFFFPHTFFFITSGLSADCLNALMGKGPCTYFKSVLTMQQ